MDRDLFVDTRRASTRVGARQWYTIPLSMLAHAAALSVVVVVPLFAIDALPTPRSLLAFAMMPPPPTPPPPLVSPPLAEAMPDRVVASDVDPGAAPVFSASRIAPEPPPLLRRVELSPAPLSNGLESSVALAGPPPLAMPVRVGGNVKAPVKIVDRKPVYPAVARAARIQGTVVLEAVIGRDGSVKNVQVLRSAPLLDQAAIEAVSQWKYTPTLLGGEPVEVVMAVTVNFGLQ